MSGTSLGDDGVVADTLLCANYEGHDHNDEVEMVSGPHMGVQCPECGRMAGGPDPMGIPYVDPSDRSVDADTDSEVSDA